MNRRKFMVYTAVVLPVMGIQAYASTRMENCYDGSNEFWPGTAPVDHLEIEGLEEAMTEIWLDMCK